MTPSAEEIQHAGLDARVCFHRLWSRVAQQNNYVPRDYPTIGGMWTVDRYRLGDIECRLMDEGWTQVICAPGLRVSVDGNCDEPRFHEGDAALLAWLAPKWP